MHRFKSQQCANFSLPLDRVPDRVYSGTKKHAAPTEYRELAPAIGAATPFGTARAIALDAPRPTSPFGDQRESGNGSDAAAPTTSLVRIFAAGAHA